MKSNHTDSSTDRLLRESLDHMGQGVTIFNRDLKLVSWNQPFLDLLGFPKELAFRGADFESFIRYNAESGEYGPGDIDAQVAERVENAWRFKPHDFERVLKNSVTIRIVGTPLPSGGFVTVYTDITEDKDREEKLRLKVEERTHQLRQSESRLRLIADEVPAGIAHIDNEMNFLFVNKRFARAYGRQPSQVIGKSCDEILNPRTLQVSSRYFERARRGAAVDFEMELTLPNGQCKEIRTYLRPEGPGEGKVIGFYLLSVDVTQLKVANTALLQSQKMDAIGRMSSGISHDFNNLLAIILGNLTPLAERLPDPILNEEFLEPAIAAARRGGDLTRRLLSLAKSEAGDPGPVRVGEVISEMLELLRSTLPQEIRIDHADRAGDPVVMADRGQLEMALLNLAMNARDAMSGQGQLTIETEPQELHPGEAEQHKLPIGSYIKISVTDDGVGLAPHERDRVFEPFFTSKASSGGTGLGLSMVFAFVKQSNGAISVESSPGLGTTFSMLLPALDPGSEDAVNDAQIHKAVDDKTRPLVLLVEDDEGVRGVVRRQLVDLGYPLIEAEDASTALDLCRSVPEIKVILSDISMPGEMDGLALAKFLSREKPGLDIILMSGHQTSLDEFGKALPFPFLAKPFEKPELADVLKSVRTSARHPKDKTA